MIDVKELERNFIESRKSHNQCKNLKPGDKGYLDENPNLISFTYNKGAGAMVIDLEQFNKFSKAKQKKILDLMKR